MIMTSDKGYSRILRKILRTMVLASGGILLFVLFVPFGVFLLTIDLIWELMDYLLCKLERNGL